MMQLDTSHPSAFPIQTGAGEVADYTHTTHHVPGGFEVENEVVQSLIGGEGDVGREVMFEEVRRGRTEDVMTIVPSMMQTSTLFSMVDAPHTSSSSFSSSSEAIGGHNYDLIFPPYIPAPAVDLNDINAPSSTSTSSSNATNTGTLNNTNNTVLTCLEQILQEENQYQHKKRPYTVAALNRVIANYLGDELNYDKILSKNYQVKVSYCTLYCVYTPLFTYHIVCIPY